MRDPSPVAILQLIHISSEHVTSSLTTSSPGLIVSGLCLLVIPFIKTCKLLHVGMYTELSQRAMSIPMSAPRGTYVNVVATSYVPMSCSREIRIVAIDSRYSKCDRCYGLCSSNEAVATDSKVCRDHVAPELSRQSKLTNKAFERIREDTGLRLRTLLTLP